MAELPQFTINLPECGIELSVSKEKAASGQLTAFSI